MWVTLGGKNITDEDAPQVFDAANFSYDPKHHDPRGQIWYGRIKLAL
jgi:iron complex outermembrane receptor protein